MTPTNLNEIDEMQKSIIKQRVALNVVQYLGALGIWKASNEKRKVFAANAAKLMSLTR